MWMSHQSWNRSCWTLRKYCSDFISKIRAESTLSRLIQGFSQWLPEKKMQWRSKYQTFESLKHPKSGYSQSNIRWLGIWYLVLYSNGVHKAYILVPNNVGNTWHFCHYTAKQVRYSDTHCTLKHLGIAEKKFFHITQDLLKICFMNGEVVP